MAKVPWQKLRATVEVKLLAQGDEVYVLAKSTGRQAKEMALRRRMTRKNRGQTGRLTKRPRFHLSKGIALRILPFAVRE